MKRGLKRIAVERRDTRGEMLCRAAAWHEVRCGAAGPDDESRPDEA